jgi:hypothetical protein
MKEALVAAGKKTGLLARASTGPVEVKHSVEGHAWSGHFAAKMKSAARQRLKMGESMSARMIITFTQLTQRMGNSYGSMLRTAALSASRPLQMGR